MVLSGWTVIILSSKPRLIFLNFKTILSISYFLSFSCFPLGRICVWISVERENCNISKVHGIENMEKELCGSIQVHVWCGFSFVDELVLMLFRVAPNSLMKANFSCLVQQFFQGKNHFFFILPSNQIERSSSRFIWMVL